jgi:hypothetical protein
VVQVRLLPVSLAVVPTSVTVVPLQQASNAAVDVSGCSPGNDTEVPPPEWPLHARSSSLLPPASLRIPQLPVPSVVVHTSRVGSGVPQPQAAAGSHWHEASQNLPAPHWPVPHGGSHFSSPVTSPSPHTLRAKHSTVILSSSFRGRVPFGALATIETIPLPGPFGWLLVEPLIVVEQHCRANWRAWGSRRSAHLPRRPSAGRGRRSCSRHVSRPGRCRRRRGCREVVMAGPRSQGSPSAQTTTLFFCT